MQSLKKTSGKKIKAARAASKTTAAYWSQKIYREEKGDWQASNYSVRFKLHGCRKRIHLKATTREEAGREALAEYLKVLAHGWPVDSNDQIELPAIYGLPSDPTISDWIAMAKKKSPVRPKSIDKYGESLRTIVGEILGMGRARKKEQRSEIGAFKVSNLTKDKLRAWLDSRMERAKDLDPLRTCRAQNTIRALIANARGLFTEQIFEAVEVVDQGILANRPFRDLKLPPKHHSRYTSRFDARTLLATAAKSLGKSGGTETPTYDAESRFEQWKILYLALVAGLRYNEIDQLRVQDISPASQTISIRAHETFRPKTTMSEADIMVSKAASRTLAAMIKKTPGAWFIKEGHCKRSPAYRAGKYHSALIRWLRSYEERGARPFADVPKPLHELRKEAGTLVNNQHGLNEAQNFLRHSSISTTAAYYVGSKGNITTGLS